MSDQIGSLMGQGSPMQLSGAAPNTSPGGGLSSLLSGGNKVRSLGGLQAGSSILEGLSKMQQYQSNAGSYGIQAGEWRTQAGDERVMGQNQISGLKQQYLADVGGLTTKAAAGGVDVGQGMQTARTQIGQNAASAGNLAMLASDIRARRDNINAIQADAAASEARQAGGMAAVGGLAMGALNLAMLL